MVRPNPYPVTNPKPIFLASLARLDPEPYNQYTVKYIGNCTVLRPTGIDIVRDAIGKLVTIHSENQWVEGQALISATTVKKHKNYRFLKKSCPCTPIHLTS